jgi:phosphomannomutase
MDFLKKGKFKWDMDEGDMAIKLSISGIRGKFHELTPNRVARYVQAFSTYLRGGEIIISSDLRPSGKFITEAVISGLTSIGSDVTDYGILPTPIIQWILKNSTFKGGISITAGHNTFDWNSLVFLNSEGSYLNHFQGEEFFNIYHSGKFNARRFHQLGGYKKSHHYLADYFEQVRSENQGGKELKFVIDCSYGMNPDLIKKLSEALKIRLIPIFCGNSGTLNKDPEPSIVNAGFLSTIVRETGSDGGFFLNSDASRILLVDEQGTPISEELTLPIFASIILENELSDIVTNYSTSRVVDQVAKKFGVKVFRTDVGQPYVVQMVKEIKAHLGGEGSGSIVYSPFSYGFDSFIVIKKILDYLKKNRLSISDIAGNFKSPQIQKETIYLPANKIYNFLEKIGNLYDNHMKLKDGFYISSGDEWLCIRASATVSMIRIIGEGKGIQEEIDRVKEQVT